MTSECSSFQILVQTGSIVIGWIVVHKLSVARDSDKARREMLSKIADELSYEVTKLLDISLKYHSHVRDTEIERTLKMTLQDLSSRTSLLTEVSNDAAELRQCRTVLLNLKKSITGTHFEDEHTTPISEGSDQIQSIAADALRLKQCFQRLKLRQFAVK